MLDGSEKDYVVYRVGRTGDVFQCHKNLWAEWMENAQARNLTMLVNNVTQKEAWRFCQLTKES